MPKELPPKPSAAGFWRVSEVFDAVVAGVAREPKGLAVLLPAPAAAKGEAVEEAKLLRPDEAKADAEVCWAVDLEDTESPSAPKGDTFDVFPKPEEDVACLCQIKLDCQMRDALTLVGLVASVFGCGLLLSLTRLAGLLPLSLGVVPTPLCAAPSPPSALFACWY